MSDAEQREFDAEGAGREVRAEHGRGLVVIVILALLTIFEFVVALAINDTVGLIAGLTPFALTKAGLIFWYFMHVQKLWLGEEDRT